MAGKWSEEKLATFLQLGEIGDGFRQKEDG
jgi:hypothetical protein